MDQASSLRSIIKKNQIVSTTRARVITVTSGKGGVGKSNISVNLAIQLKKLGKRVIIFDADFGLANVEVIFGIVPKHNLFDIIYNDMSVSEVLTNGPLGIEFLSGGSGVKELLKLDQAQITYLIEKMGELDKYADIIIIDTGAGISEAVLSFICASEEIILVTTPEPTSVTDAYAVLKAIRNERVQIEDKNINVLVNRVSSDEEGFEIYDKLSRVSKKFLNIELNSIGFLPEDRSLPKAVIEQTPVSILFPKSNIAKGFEKLGTNVLHNKLYEKKEQKGISSIFSSIIRRKDRG
ncbi:MAG: MinD/ParA family protein [Vallitaleaceae bacterium]|nr:MinD/ParA family protein [Vallitaleaceae bacterium]